MCKRKKKGGGGFTTEQKERDGFVFKLFLLVYKKKKKDTTGVELITLLMGGVAVNNQLDVARDDKTLTQQNKQSNVGHSMSNQHKKMSTVRFRRNLVCTLHMMTN